MTTDQALSPKLWPDPFQWSNYTEVFDQAPMLRYALNTATDSVLATLGMLVSSIPVAYALARCGGSGRNVAFVLVLVAMMLPPQVTIVPIYVIWAKLNLVGTLSPLIIPNWFGDAFSIFLLRQFFLTIRSRTSTPRASTAAASCGSSCRSSAGWPSRRSRRSRCPCSCSRFSDFFGPLLYAGDQEATGRFGRPCAVPHAAPGAVEPDMAATIMVLCRWVVLFFFAQKAFVEGVTLTGVKE